MADSGQHRAMVAALKAQFPTLAITSTYRPGAITATGNPSYHGKGKAVDMAPRMEVFNWIAANYPNSSELIFSPAGSRQIRNGKPHIYTGITRAQHFDHIHWAMESFAGGGGTVVAVDNENPLTALNPLQPLIDAFNFLTSPGTWLRIGTGVLGAALIMAAFLALTGRNVITLVKGATRAR